MRAIVFLLLDKRDSVDLCGLLKQRDTATGPIQSFGFIRTAAHLVDLRLSLAGPGETVAKDLVVKPVKQSLVSL